MKTIKEFFDFTKEHLWTNDTIKEGYVFLSELSEIPIEFNFKLDKSFMYFECELKIKKNKIFVDSIDSFYGLKEKDGKIYININNRISEVIIKEEHVLELKNTTSLYLFRHITNVY